MIRLTIPVRGRRIGNRKFRLRLGEQINQALSRCFRVTVQLQQLLIMADVQLRIRGSSIIYCVSGFGGIRQSADRTTSRQMDGSQIS